MMKELTPILPEDYEEKIDYSKAKFAINVEGLLCLRGLDGWRHGTRYDSFYDIINGEPVKLTPEPRSPNSIKLSECDPKKHILMIESDGVVYRVTFDDIQLHHSTWVVRCRDGSIECHGDLVRLCKGFENIRVYDITSG